MKISNIQSTYSYSNINNNFLFNTFGCKSTQITNYEAFQKFKSWADSNSFLDNAKEIISNPQNIIGSGFEGKVYSIPNSEDWVIKEYFRSSILPISKAESQIQEIEDISPQLNIGQAIAKVYLPINEKYAESFFIHKKQTGRPVGVDAVLMNSITDGTSKTHLESLQRVANLPQESFNQVIDDITTISKLGYKIDGTTPNNILLDDKTNRINFVDIADKDPDKKSQYAEVLYPLLGASFSERFIESNRPHFEKLKAKELSEVIISKFITAMNFKNVKFDSSYNYLRLRDLSVFNDFIKNN